MDLLSPLGNYLEQASLQGLQTEVEFAVTILSSIAAHLSSRIQDGSRMSVIRKKGSRKNENVPESFADTNILLTDSKEFHQNNVEEERVLSRDSFIEYHDTVDKVYGVKVQKPSVITFGLNNSFDNTEEGEREKPIIKCEDTYDYSAESFFQGNVDQEDITLNRDELPPTIFNGSTALTAKEQSFIQNCWAKLGEIESSEPKVLRQTSLPCDFCDFKTTSIKNPMSELRLHRNDAHLLCCLCDARHSTKPELKKHFNKIHKRNSRSFVCGIASCTFEVPQSYNLRKLYYHIRNEHMDFLSACRVCKKTFERLRNRKRHESDVHNVGTHSRVKKKMCLHCGFLTKASNMSAHIRNMHTILPTLKCSICDFETRNGNKRLKKHEQLHSVEKVKCDLCDYSTRVKETLLKHKKKVHEDEEVYMCTSCNYKTPNRTNLSMHELSHSIDKPYLCHKCDFKTKTESSLTVHSLYHQDPKFLCDQCDYKSCSSGNLHTHKVVKHGTSNHECDQCGKLFNYNRHLQRHQANHEGANIQCNECDMQFYRKDKLKEHLASVHKISEPESSMLRTTLGDPSFQQRTTENNENIPRSHICPDCPKTFTCSKHLSRHKNSVHSAVELACRFCHKTFSRKDKLNIHTSFSCKLKV